jgi:hypothetical protein
MHTYLGNATGDGVVNGGTSGLRPQQIKLWTKISNVKTYTVLDNVTTGDDDELLKLKVKPTADSGSTCTMASGSSRQMSLSGWKADADDEFPCPRPRSICTPRSAGMARLGMSGVRSRRSTGRPADDRQGPGLRVARAAPDQAHNGRKNSNPARCLLGHRSQSTQVKRPLRVWRRGSGCRRSRRTACPAG